MTNNCVAFEYAHSISILHVFRFSSRTQGFTNLWNPLIFVRVITHHVAFHTPLREEHVALPRLTGLVNLLQKHTSCVWFTEEPNKKRFEVGGYHLKLFERFRYIAVQIFFKQRKSSIKAKIFYEGDRKNRSI